MYSNRCCWAVVLYAISSCCNLLLLNGEKERNIGHYSTRTTSYIQLNIVLCWYYLVAIIGPATELHVTMLVIKGEPRNVYLACALEDARWNVQAAAVMSDHNVGVVGPVETFIGTCGKKL